MKDRLITWSILVVLMTIAILPGFVPAQVVSGSINTPSGYSIDAISGNLIPYDSSLKTNTGTWTSTSGSSGGWVPYGSPQGSFNATDGYTFSYLGEELGVSGINLSNFSHGYQNTNAVFVTGFMYGLKYRFPCANSIGGNCENTGGPQDTLRVEVGYYPSSGTPTFYVHQLGLKNIEDGNSAYNPNWQTLAQTVTFAGAKTLAQAGSVNMGIYGQDAGYWACLQPDCYGPQVKDAYIKANYSVDPCILNPAFNPSCPGFSSITQGGQSPLYWWGYNIAARLPHIGGGVQIYGFDYGFGYYAGEYCTNTFLFWCTSYSGANGGTINFRITDKNNQELFKDSHYREGNYSGGSYSNRFLFTETQNSLNLGGIQWYATGVWGDNFQWSAWTRPIWSPDPCYTQPLYSPNCSNFDVTIKKLAEDQEAARQVSLSNTVSSVGITPTSTITTTITDPNSTNPAVVVHTNNLPPPPPIDGQQPKPPPPREELPLRLEARELSTRSVARVETNNDSTTLALNLVRQNQQRETTIAQQASQTAIQTANIAATTSVRQAESLALDAAKISQTGDRQDQQVSIDVVAGTAKQDQILMLGPQPGSTSVVNINQQPRQQQAIVDTVSPQTNTSTSAVVVFNAMQVNVNVTNQETVQIQLPVFTQTQTIQQSVYQPPQQILVENKPQANFQQDSIAVGNQTTILQTPQQLLEVQQPQLQVAAIQSVINVELPITSVQLPQQIPIVSVDVPQSQQSFTTDRTNPLNALLEAKPTLPQEDVKETKIASVNQKSEDSTLAGGVSINAINVVPVGFSAYSVTLADASFYQPKEIYRNQRTIDNRRALQNLRSDQLHQQMINQQWR
jgi:hypothetical protein